VRSAADDRHGASLQGFRVTQAHENPASQARRVPNSARPPRVCYLIFSGRSPGLRGALLGKELGRIKCLLPMPSAQWI
jgi:hypothetical protein